MVCPRYPIAPFYTAFHTVTRICAIAVGIAFIELRRALLTIGGKEAERTDEIMHEINAAELLIPKTRHSRNKINTEKNLQVTRLGGEQDRSYSRPRECKSVFLKSLQERHSSAANRITVMCLTSIVVPSNPIPQ